MKKTVVMLGMAFVAITVLNAQTLNSEKSLVKFSIENMQVRTVEGTFRGMKGEISFDEMDPANSNFRICVDAATVNTENEKRDDHLRNEDFFHVKEYPVISFESSEVLRTSNGYLSKGTLTMHGVSKEVEIPFTYENGKFSGILEVNRFDYGIGENTKTLTVGDTATLEIIAVQS